MLLKAIIKAYMRAPEYIPAILTLIAIGYVLFIGLIRKEGD